MDFNRPSSRVLALDEKYGVPLSIYWTTEELADWICEIGYPLYRDCIVSNNIAGRHLISLDASRLPDIGITDFYHIKDIASKIRDLIGLNHIIKNMSVSMSNPMIAYMDMKRKTGEMSVNITFKEFLQKYRMWYSFEYDAMFG